MHTILTVHSSPRSSASYSRKIAEKLSIAIAARYDKANCITRDLSAQPTEHINNLTIEGFYTPPEQMTEALTHATHHSDELITELQSAQTLIISAPMYNFSLPSNLKAWIDHIVRINHTFSYDGQGFTGLVNVQKAYLALAYGARGYAEGGSFRAMNFLEPYLVSLLSFLGIGEIEIFSLQGTTTVDTELDRDQQQLFEKIQNL